MTHLLRAAVSLAGLFHATAVLGQTTTLECDYPRYSDGETIQRPKQRFALTFLVDKAKGTAYILGNQGSAEVNLVPSPNGFTFIEITPTGNVMTTVVDLYGNSTHSRGTRIDGKLLASQYYGTCKSK
jgi:hypothetical protein